MSISENIIKKFGGLSALAKALGHSHPTTVQGWRDRGGIPARRQPDVLAKARELGIDLSPADFFPAEPASAEPGKAA